MPGGDEQMLTLTGIKRHGKDCLGGKILGRGDVVAGREGKGSQYKVPWSGVSGGATTITSRVGIGETRHNEPIITST